MVVVLHFSSYIHLNMQTIKLHLFWRNLYLFFVVVAVPTRIVSRSGFFTTVRECDYRKSIQTALRVQHFATF